MKQNQKLLIAIGLGLLILVNVLVLGWLLTDFFSGSNEPEKTVAATDDWENTTVAESTEELTTEEPTTEELTTEEPTTEELTTEELTTEEPTTEEIPTVAHLPETEQVFEEVRYPVYNRYPGNGEYEIGYSVDEAGNLTGPESFAIEGKNIAILDEGNNRIYYYSEDYFSRGHISLENLMYGSKKLSVNKIMSVSDSEVVFDGSFGSATMRFRYEKEADLQRVLGITANEQRIMIGDHIATVIGKVGDRMYYQYRTGEGKDDKNVIGMVVENVGIWYVTQDLSGYRTIPSDNLYVSQDGKLYLMECFDDQMVISELKLGEPEEESTEESTEDFTKEPTPYDEVLDEYFAKREALYTATEESDFDPERWQYIQKRKKNLGATFTDAEVTYKNLEIISETDSEVKLRLFESAKITYVYDGYYEQHTTYDQLPHIIRLSKQDGKYQIQTDSWWDMMANYQTGLEEDIKLLIPGSDSFAG